MMLRKALSERETPELMMLRKALSERETPALQQRPRWDCRDKKEQERFITWTLARLIEYPEPGALDFSRDPMMLGDPKYADAVEQDLRRRLKRGRVRLAAENKDIEALAQLADTPELRRLAFTLAFAKHGRGRAKGEARPRDLPQPTRERCEEALADVKRIRKIWQHHYGRRNRASQPTALGIAAGAWGLDPDDLINFQKNRRRR